MEAEKTGISIATIDLATCYDMSEVTVSRKYGFKLKVSVTCIVWRWWFGHFEFTIINRKMARSKVFCIWQPDTILTIFYTHLNMLKKFKTKWHCQFNEFQVLTGNPSCDIQIQKLHLYQPISVINIFFPFPCIIAYAKIEDFA